jgi:hypothetical protein
VDLPEKVTSKLAENAQPTTLYLGKQLLKTDIEDLIMNHCKRKPEKPDIDDCCGQGCDPCVFDTYETHMEKYDDQMQEYESLLLEFEE